MVSDHHCQSLRLWANCNRLAAADANVAKDPKVDAARQSDGQTQEQEADETLRAQRDVGGKRRVLGGSLGCTR